MAKNDIFNSLKSNKPCIHYLKEQHITFEYMMPQ